MFRFLFKKRPLAGMPPVRRLKTYSAETGYVYQYFYEGQRPCRVRRENGIEYVFSVSAGGAQWLAVNVVLCESALRAWEAAHSRELSSTERYALAKMALFQAFDERGAPSDLKSEVRVRQADLEALASQLGF